MGFTRRVLPPPPLLWDQQTPAPMNIRGPVRAQALLVQVCSHAG